MTPLSPVRSTDSHPPVVPAPRPASSFSLEPAARSEPPRVLLDAVHSLERGQRFVDRVIRQALAGRDFSQDELLAIQAGVYRYTQELELFSRMVEKAVASVKQTLGTQT